MPKTRWTIRIDDEVYRLIRKNAKPLVDSPNSVLRRLLGLEEKKPLSPKDKTA